MTDETTQETGWQNKSYDVTIGQQSDNDQSARLIIVSNLLFVLASLTDALEAWRAGVAPFIIVCGGQGDKEPMPEAEAMASWFIDQGVPAERVIADPDSINTLQNLQNARAIMEARGFKSCAVCTSGYHLRRALWLAKDVGLNATGIAAPSTRDAVSVVRGRLRETCSWILYFIRKLF